MQSRILVVDDNPKNIQVLATHLTNYDYEVEYASNGKEAVQMIEREDFDLILLDVMMPRMDGMETCIELKNNKKLKNTYITFLTARNEDYSQIAGFEAGADDYITKPFSMEELMVRINAVLRRSNKNRSQDTDESAFSIGKFL